MIYLLLFLEFLKIGLFSIGGGLATLPFIRTIIDNYDWITNKQLLDIVAIAESTPGPIGVNVATFVGYRTAGFFGGFIATFGLVLPSVFVISLIAHYFMKFDQNRYVRGALAGIRPVVVGLIGAVAFQLGLSELVDLPLEKVNGFDFLKIKEILLFLILLFLIRKYEKHPIFYLGIAAVVGVILG